MTENMVLDEDKILNPDIVRLNLLLSSLYITAFEILKTTLVEGVAGIIVYLPKPNELSIMKLKDVQPEEEFDEYRSAVTGAYQRLVEEYEDELRIRYEDRQRYGLIPSSQWLHKSGEILLEEDVNMIRTIRNHRNAVVHELPTLLVSKEHNVDLGYLEQMMSLINKVTPFFARIDVEIPDDVADEDIMSGSQAVLSLIMSAVGDYLLELSD